MSFSVDAILSLIATLVSLMVFLLMLEESLALTAGRDPITNDVRSAVRRFPRVTYAIAVVIGMMAASADAHADVLASFEPVP